MDNVPTFYAANRKEWRSWLESNHDKETAIWLVFDKGKDRTMSWEDIVQESLCFGWIDSRPGKVSDTQSKIYISKRKPKSVWSKINKQHIEKLIENNLMTTSGMKAIDVAKENGSWNALDLSDNLVYPPELIKLFNIFPDAKINFESFPTGSRRNTLQWIYDAKTDATRIKRIEETVNSAKLNKRLR